MATEDCEESVDMDISLEENEIDMEFDVQQNDEVKKMKEELEMWIAKKKQIDEKLDAEKKIAKDIARRKNMQKMQKMRAHIERVKKECAGSEAEYRKIHAFNERHSGIVN